MTCLDSDEIQFLEFADICNNEIYFAVENTDIECDALERSKSIMRMIKSNSQLFLVASKDLEFHTMTDPAERRFQIKLYKNTDPSNGLAVTIQFFSNHTWRVVHCTEEGNCKRVTASPMQVPDSLPNSSNEAVFFLQAVRGQNNKYRFESSVWRQWYLSVSLEGDVYKLVLRKVADEVDEAAQFFMTKPEG